MEKFTPLPNWRAATFDECEDIRVGDYVRSYDFEHRDDCYVEGFVEEVADRWGCLRYTLRCRYSVSQGKRREVDATKSVVYPPTNGTRIAGSDSYCNGVRKVRGE
jgi:hypothetical protein